MTTGTRVTVGAAHSDAEVRREAAQMLGAAAAPATPLRLAPRVGMLALLDLIDSPLLDGRQATRLDMIRALYVCAVGPAAVRPVALGLRVQESLESAAALAAANPEHFSRWLEALAGAAEHWLEFDAAALDWLEASGIADLPAAFRALGEAFADALRGFSTIQPTPGEQQSPFAGASAPSGSPPSGPAATPSAS